MADRPPAPERPPAPPMLSADGWLRLAALATLLVGLLAAPTTTLLGATLGTLFELDPTSPGILGHVVHGVLTLLAGCVGVVLLLLALASAGGMLFRQPWAHAIALLFAVLCVLSGLWPVALVLFVALLQPHVLDACWGELLWPDVTTPAAPTPAAPSTAPAIAPPPPP